MRMVKDEKGFSLVELIIVMGIMAIAATMIMASMGYINRGKTEKAASTLDSKLSYIQTETLTKAGTTYLYLYPKSDGIYYFIKRAETGGNTADGDGTGFASYTELNTYLTSKSIDGTRLCGSQVKASGKGGSGVTDINLAAGGSDMLKIGYKKSTGAFECCNNGSGSFRTSIVLTGKETFTVKLVEKTGKHKVSAS